MRLQQEFSKRRARIEIIPLIDIIFFLLATFVMVSFSMIKNQGIPVRLPKAVTGTADQRVVSTTVTIKENGDIYFNKEKMTSQDLMQRLSHLKKSDPEQKIFINGDELAYFGDVVTILDQIRGVGIDKIGIQTKGAPAQSSSTPNQKKQ